MATPEEKLSEMGITLPAAPAPAANYVPYTIAGKLLTISGQLPMGAEGLAFKGKLGGSMAVDEGQQAAQLCALNILAQAKAALGDLSGIKQIVKINGFVNATPEFEDHAQVINGASNFLADVLGDAGRHARAAVGMGSLPFGAAVEIDAVIEIA